MEFYECLQSVYNKKKIDLNIDTGLVLVLTKILIRNKKNANALKEIADYLFYVDPLHYYYLLYFSIPYAFRAPSTFKTTKKVKKKRRPINDQTKICIKLVGKRTGIK